MPQAPTAPPAPARSSPPLSWIKATAIINWYLRTLDLGTHREELNNNNKVYTLPLRTPELACNYALFIVHQCSHYVSSVKRVSPAQQDPLDITPISLIYRVALGIAAESYEKRPHRSSPPNYANWEEYGCPQRCMVPQVWSHFMHDLYVRFKNGAWMAPHLNMRALYTRWKNVYIGYSRTAQVCTAYLRTLDLGRPLEAWETVQVIFYEVYPPRIYYCALYLLQRCAGSMGFKRKLLEGLPAQWAFYVTRIVAAQVLCDETYSPKDVLWNLGFSPAIESRTGRRVCFPHAELQLKREGEGILAGGKPAGLKVPPTQNEGTQPKDKIKKKERHDEKDNGGIFQLPEGGKDKGEETKPRCPPFREYIGCGLEMFPWIDGMMRLKEWMLIMVFYWTVSIQHDHKSFYKFEKFFVDNFKPTVGDSCLRYTVLECAWTPIQEMISAWYMDLEPIYKFTGSSCMV